MLPILKREDYELMADCLSLVTGKSYDVPYDEALKEASNECAGDAYRKLEALRAKYSMAYATITFAKTKFQVI